MRRGIKAGLQHLSNRSSSVAAVDLAQRRRYACLEWLVPFTGAIVMNVEEIKLKRGIGRPLVPQAPKTALYPGSDTENLQFLCVLLQISLED